MMSRAPRAWWLETKSYARRIAPPPPRFTRQPQKEKMFLAFMERTFFFFWVLPVKIFGQCGGAKCSLRSAKLFFWGKGFAKTSADFCLYFPSALRMSDRGISLFGFSLGFNLVVSKEL